MNNRLIFGTDGIRSAIGSGCFTDKDLVHLAHAIGHWATQKYGTGATLIIGHDTRESCGWIKHILIATLNRHGHHTYDAGTLPTPTICWLTLNTPAIDCGIIISASHNPWNHNGIKLCDKKTGKIDSIDEQAITVLFHAPHIPDITATSFGSHQFLHQPETPYLHAIHALFRPHFLRGMTIVLDCANGSTASLAPALFNHFGARVIAINNEPNGKNINEECGSLHPATLQKMVLEHNADIGFAFDGDGDRLIAVERAGALRDGDDIIALLSTHPRYVTASHIVGTSMSNYGLEQWLALHNKTLVRTAVGDKYVAQQLHERNLWLGGEQSGHIIMRDFLYTGDGIFTALRVLETMIITTNTLFSTFTRCPQVLMNVPMGKAQPIDTRLMTDLIKEHEEKLVNGRILVRYSGTEPLLRVMVEDSCLKSAQHICALLSETCKRLLHTY